jgi:organic hydroperoxide reductase OsmC/OhrA
MPQPFPHHYVAELEPKDDATSWLKAPPRPPLLGGNPPEFDGNAEWWSPEHLLLAALQVCYRGTFNALAARAGLKPTAYHTRAEATLDKTDAGIVFTKIELSVTVTVAATEVEKAKELAAKAKKYCITSNQLKTEPTLVLDVRAG